MTLKDRLKGLEKGVDYMESLQFNTDAIHSHVKKECEPIFSILHPSFTIHNIEHSESVISNLDNFCQLMELFDEYNEKKLSKYEIFLLLAGAYLHDIGMIVIKDEEKVRLIEDSDSKFLKNELSYKIREDHHIRSAEYIIQNNSIFHITATDSNNIGLICEGHGECDLLLERYHDRKDHTNRSDITAFIRMHFLIALLRLADELDISCERAPEFIRKVLQDWSLDRISQFHWMKHYYTGIPMFGVEKIGRNKKVTITIPLNVPDGLHGKRMKAMLENRIEEEIKRVNQIVKEGCEWSFQLKSITLNINSGLESTPEDVFRAYFIGDKPLKILLIEDDKEWKKNFKKALGDEFSIFVAQDEISAMDKIKSEYFQLIVLDLHLPDKEGYYSKEVGYLILQYINKFCPNSIVLIVSGKVNFSDSKKMKDLKILNYYISKSEFYGDSTNPPKQIIETTVKEHLHLLKKIEFINN